MKKLLLFLIFGIMLLLPITVKAEGKVKVYVFEAGGCPYCEMEVEYLEGLESYGEKFEIVRKELYVDHVDWQKGKDYNLGVQVANAFLKNGYEDASAHGTPFVVISNIYAQTGYNPDLVDVINKAYEAGDADIVSCIAEGKSDCVIADPNKTEKENKEEATNEILPIVGLIIITAALVTIVVLVRKSNKEEEELDKVFADEEEEIVKVKKEKPVKAVKVETKKVVKKKPEGKAKTNTKSTKPKASESKKTTKTTKKTTSKK